MEVHTARQVQQAPLPSGYMEFFRHSGVTSLECNKGGSILKGKDLGLRRREASDPCGMEGEEGSHVSS